MSWRNIPLTAWSIPEIYVDYVVQIDAIGDPAGIVSGTTRMTRQSRCARHGTDGGAGSSRIPGFA